MNKITSLIHKIYGRVKDWNTQDKEKKTEEDVQKGIKVYTNWLISPEEDTITPVKTQEQFKNSINNILSKIEKWKNPIDLLQAIYSFLSEIWNESFPIYEVEIDTPKYYKLTKYSKKKLLVKKFKEKYPDRQERKKILSDAITILWYDLDLSDQLKGIWLDPLIINLAQLLSENGNIDMQQLASLFINDMGEGYQKIFINTLKASGANENIIKKFESYIWQWEEIKTIIEEDDYIDTEENNSLRIIKTSERMSNSDFNPLVYDLDLNLWLKIFNFNRLKEIYKDLFFKIVLDLTKDSWWTPPSFNKLLLIQKSKFKNINKHLEKKDNEKEVFQFTIEWDIPEDFIEEDLKKVAKMLNIDWLELNLNNTESMQAFNHPIKTDSWIQEYIWHFNNSWDDFLGESVIIIKNKKDKTKKIRLTLNERFNQDSYTYFLSQISYYISKRKFLNKQQLYFNIYDRYNKEIYGWNESFDITFFEKQYRQLMEKLIIPLSTEWKELWIKAHNTLLAWIYWSWKSQFLLKILKDKRFKLDWKEFNLNANVIYLDLQSFKALLWTPIWWIRTKLDEIYQNTKTPILLVIEDIDTLINEKISWQNDEIAQAMTVFFEWIWSIPINIIATANDPSKLSERIVRPNRIYEIIEFYLANKEEKINILKIHLQKNWFNISDSLLKKLLNTKVFKEWTASHIAAFCEQLSSKIKIKEVLWEKKTSLSNEEILELAEHINISSSDIMTTITSIQKWVETVTWNWKWINNIWFIDAK